MLEYSIRRLLELIPVLFIVSVLVFMTMHLLPGDPAQLMLAGAEGGAVSAERIEELRESMGLNEPLLVQYGRYILGAVQGDLGESIRFRTPVRNIILTRFPYTLRLSIAGLVFALAIGLSLGTIAALARGSWLDGFSMMISLIGVSMPIFWLGLLLILFFSIRLQWLPTSGAESWQALVMPAFTLGFVSAALISRLTRSSLLEVLQQDYIRTARSKGVGKVMLILRHAAKNVMIPIITVIGLQFGSMLAGAVVTETVFSRPGLGRLVVNAILWKDYPLVQGTVLFLALMYVLVNLLVDLSYAWFDPRIRYQ